MIKGFEGNHFTVRFLSLEINNFSCIRHGSVSMVGADSSVSDILGVYGQNGSGKSALVNALAFLRLLLCGAGIESISHYVRAGETEASFKAEFLIFGGEKTKKFEYSVTVRQNRDAFDKWAVKEEKTVVSDFQNPKNKMSFEYSALEGPSHVKPASLADSFVRFMQGKVRTESSVDKSDSVPPELFFLMQREISRFYKSSYIFHPNMLRLYQDYGASVKEETLADYLFIMNEYAQKFMFVMNDSFLQDPMQRESKLPVLLPNQSFSKPGQLGYFALELENPTYVIEQNDGEFGVFLAQINYFLEPLVPGICLVAKRIEQSAMDSAGGKLYQVFSRKNGFDVPLKFESLGIKKLISLINVMVLAYKNPSVLMVVDEFDSSMHECVLKTFFTALKEGGKGQLLFTSNNLYPLELLDRTQCCFTTVNEEDRFATLKYVKPNNNLRSLYLSEICGSKKDSKNPGLFNPISAEKTRNVFESEFYGEKDSQNL